MPEERFSEEKVRGILQYALNEEMRTGDFTDQQLRQMAAELGISDEALARAKLNYRDESPLSSPSERSDELSGLGVTPQLRRQFERWRWRNFATRLIVYGLFVLFLFVVDLVTGGDFWFYWPMIVFGFLLVFNAVRLSLARLNPDQYEDELLEWLAKRVDRRQLIGRATNLLSDA
ncbi:MAG: 2TM domain-containing protein [Anaerolineales bacterium]|nr:2TM domain-containing protein [Anaerolineales bacterium]MCB9128366.1 2TM domain-containing protein [Ardenticatenales bacterium]MCB9172178.1 2TM domain-containing protein [Ardenticatenales bacterium]